MQGSIMRVIIYLRQVRKLVNALSQQKDFCKKVYYIVSSNNFIQFL